MRKPRFTFQGAYHHIMSRAIGGEYIFSKDEYKDYFLSIIKEELKKQKIKILAYCIMNNHYHLILQNTSGRMAAFMREINGRYGIYYRSKVGGKGYVFQDRYKSTLVQDGKYLRMVIIYVLLNPVRAHIVNNPYQYRWSSINEYFNEMDDSIVDNKFVEGLFDDKETMDKLLREWGVKISGKTTKLGMVVGNNRFIKEAIRKFDRRKNKGESKRMREKDYMFTSPDKVIKKFERDKGIKIEDIDTKTLAGKRLCGELLVFLKDKAGLTYREIIIYPPFINLRYSSLAKIYNRTRKKMKYEL